MELYKNKQAFIDVIREASNYFKINESLIEKDYFVTLLLKELTKEIPGLLFKGGTCLSKAYKAINRFSEDIDLSLDIDHFGRNHNIKANQTVLSVCKRLGFRIANIEEVEKHTHGNFNRYIIEYPLIFPSSAIKPYIQIEMSFLLKSFPHESRKIDSLIGQFLNEKGFSILVKEYEITPFEMCVQKMERTFIDKVFALCDYYERNLPERNSRHIYDLYMISKHIDIQNESFKDLIKNVRENRKNNEKCISAKDGYNINLTLKTIVESDYFKKDYENVTSLLLTKPIEYQMVITVLEKIINQKLF